MVFLPEDIDLNAKDRNCLLGETAAAHPAASYVASKAPPHKDGNKQTDQSPN